MPLLAPKLPASGIKTLAISFLGLVYGCRLITIAHVVPRTLVFYPHAIAPAEDLLQKEHCELQ